MAGMPDERQLRTTFDDAAPLYQSARPDYPDALFTDLLEVTHTRPSARLLEIGCGPGKATLPLARMGFPIVAVELGENLAEEARRNLVEFSQVRVITTAFEQWQPAGLTFDLAYAATAWGWIHPRTKYAKAADLLRPGGHLAVWNAGHAFPPGFDPFFTEIQEVYVEIGESRGEIWPPPPPEATPDLSAEFEASDRFEVVGVRRYVWSRRYTADAYIALLDTFSGHIAMERAKRDHLYAEIRRKLAARPDGQVTRHWGAVLTAGRRL